MILIVSSNKDTASQNIKKQMLKGYKFEKSSENFQENAIYEAQVNEKEVKLITIDEESVYAQNLPNFFSSLQSIVFISRHSSESGTPTLSVHTPGNLGEAQLGGLPRKVSVAPANAMRETLKAMAQIKQENKLEYEVSYECTHHGPSLDVPTMFAELGSSPTQWNDAKAAEAVAHATIEAISKSDEESGKAVLGVGGPHYNAKFTRIALENDLAFGHIIPKYAVPSIDKEILRQCVEKTKEKVDHAVLDWKGIKGENKQMLVRILNEISLPFEKV
jgi:D-aminoacyl-tRNA deacylase